MSQSLALLARVIAISLLPAAAAAAAQYDLLIRNGRIVDGTGNAWFGGDVAVKDGKISVVGAVVAAATTARTIDATGLVVAPGFIDVHTHVDADILEHPDAENFVRDGVTTATSANSLRACATRAPR
jgi:N-acyl-D-amino-acid deacylase